MVDGRKGEPWGSLPHLSSSGDSISQVPTLESVYRQRALAGVVPSDRTEKSAMEWLLLKY